MVGGLAVAKWVISCGWVVVCQLSSVFYREACVFRRKLHANCMLCVVSLGAKFSVSLRRRWDFHTSWRCRRNDPLTRQRDSESHVLAGLTRQCGRLSDRQAGRPSASPADRHTVVRTRLADFGEKWVEELVMSSLLTWKHTRGRRRRRRRGEKKNNNTD